MDEEDKQDVDSAIKEQAAKINSGVLKNNGKPLDSETQERFQKRYDIEKQNQLNQGAMQDESNGSLIRTSKKTDKLAATSREGNIALEVDRPVLPVCSFKSLKDSLLSNPEAQALEHLLKPEKKFLDINQAEDAQQDTTIMVSFPRSGNTLLRAYLEKIMGLTSGSDCDITKKLNKDLMLMGLAGEGLVDKRVWVVKTHYPERYGKTKFYAERAILLVRNPMDCITSLYNMVATGSHNRSIEDNDFNKFPKVWGDFVTQDISVWKDFHDFWLNAKIPVHIIRYEDIVQTPEPTLKSLLEFILNVDTISGTKIEHFLKIAVQEASPQIYKPREGKVLANLEKFDEQKLDFMYQYTQDLLYKMNYVKIYELVPSDLPYSTFIEEFNKKNLKESIRLQDDSNEVTSIYVNFPALLLRKKSEMYPTGRTSHRFKNFLRRRVTIIDKNKDRVDQNEVQDKTDADDAEQETPDTDEKV